MDRSELEKVHLSNGGRSRTAAACSGVEFRNGSQLQCISKHNYTRLPNNKKICSTQEQVQSACYI